MAEDAAFRCTTAPEAWSDISEWYDRYHKPLVAYLVPRAPCTRLAEDIAQEAFVHLWFARDAGPIREPEKFLFAQARNLLKDTWWRQVKEIWLAIRAWGGAEFSVLFGAAAAGFRRHRR